MPMLARCSFLPISPPLLKRSRALSRWKQTKSLTAAFCLLTAPAFAQQESLGEPLSAIEWLSRSVEIAPLFEPPVTDTALTPDVTTSPLALPSKDPVGILPPRVTGLPQDIWAASDEAALLDLIKAERIDMLPALQDFLKVLMMAEADPPHNAGTSNALFLARVDKLLDMGALEQAKTLIEQATPDTPALFRRWFDVALLTGTEDAACDVMQETPSIAGNTEKETSFLRKTKPCLLPKGGPHQPLLTGVI